MAYYSPMNVGNDCTSGTEENNTDYVINDDIETETGYFDQNETNNDDIVDQLLINDESECVHHDIGIHRDF